MCLCKYLCRCESFKQYTFDLKRTDKRPRIGLVGISYLGVLQDKNKVEQVLDTCNVNFNVNS